MKSQNRSGKALTIILILAVIFIGVPLIIGGCGASMVIGKYNTMKVANNAVDYNAGNVDSVIQRRMDLIPNLVNTTKGYMKFEKETFVEVTAERSKAGQANISFKDLQNVTPEQIQNFQAAQQSFAGAISRLLVVMEKYPELKSNESVKALMDELAGSENRISTERRRYNEAVEALNNHIDVFPGNFVAQWFSIERRVMFKADEAARTAPKVDLSL